MTLATIIFGVIGISVVLLAFMFLKSNQVNLTGKTEEKPEWMSSNPPAETVEATKAEGEGFTLQGASTLGSDSAWTDITDNIFPDLATDSLFFDASESNYRFFRLRKAGDAN